MLLQHPLLLPHATLVLSHASDIAIASVTATSIVTATASATSIVTATSNVIAIATVPWHKATAVLMVLMFAYPAWLDYLAEHLHIYIYIDIYKDSHKDIYI